MYRGLPGDGDAHRAVPARVRLSQPQITAADEPVDGVGHFASDRTAVLGIPALGQYQATVVHPVQCQPLEELAVAVVCGDHWPAPSGCRR
ncbi:MAG: hypothetical protein ACRDTE_18515 [Pseudonocardiaceae bacterium]